MTENQVLQDAARFLEEQIKVGFRAQGHRNTGRWEDSLTSTSLEPNHIEGVAQSYGMIVNAGTTAGRIPFSGTSHGIGSGALSGEAANSMNFEHSGGSNGKSAYIQGLYNFFKSKGKSDKEALSFAFATAKKQKIEGMSTEASRLYSSTGERQNFLASTIDAVGLQLDNKILDGLNEVIMSEVNEVQTQTI